MAAQRGAVVAYVALGANLGDAQKSVQQAMNDLGELPGTQVLERSAVLRTAPWQTEGPDFFNAVVRLQTLLTAPALLLQLQRLEQLAKRERPYRYAPRTLDLDLIFYGSAHIDSAWLQVPHPRWHERDFVKQPLAQLTAPNAL